MKLEPEDSHKVIMSVNLPWGLIKEIDAMAKAEFRSRSGQVLLLLTEILAAKREANVKEQLSLIAMHKHPHAVIK